jgi:hypothetical protein
MHLLKWTERLLVCHAPSLRHPLFVRSPAGRQLIETRHMTEDGACAVIFRGFNRSTAVSDLRDPFTVPCFLPSQSSLV